MNNPIIYSPISKNKKINNYYEKLVDNFEKDLENKIEKRLLESPKPPKLVRQTNIALDPRYVNNNKNIYNS